MKRHFLMVGTAVSILARRSKRRVILWSITSFAVVLCYLFAVSDISLLSWRPRFGILYPPLSFSDADSEKNSFLVSTVGCRIPSIDPFDELIKFLIEKVDIEKLRIKCGTLPQLTVAHKTDNVHVRITVNTSVLHAYGVVSEESLECKATPILINVNGVNVDEYRYATSHVSFNATYGIDVVNDHLRVQCFFKDKLIYTDFYATIQIRPALEERCDALFRRFAEATSQESGGADRLHRQDAKDRLSVFILTLDSVSRVNVHRHMPRTAEYLQSTMNAVEMLGYNKLGDNTFPIIVTILMGLSDDEVSKKCSSKYTNMDTCPFIWKEFSKHGYRTAYGEDAQIVQAFYTERDGFRKQPTDYYLRPIMKAEYDSEKRTPWNPDDYYCFAKRIQAPVLIDYARDFAAAMKNKPYFGYFHTSGLTHDDMNWAQLIDPMVYDFLEESHQGSYFNNTVLILMSDHGARFGPIRETYIGKMEESLPFLYLVFPPWFMKKHPEAMLNLHTNTGRLVSSFDIHETLKDILHARYEPRTVVHGTGSSRAARPRQLPDRMSLFGEIPGTRTCTSANIPEHYCACQTVELVSNETEAAYKASKDVVTKVNELTQASRNICAEYSVDYVSKIYALKPTSAFTANKLKLAMIVIDYTVIVMVKPGSAQFEGTVRFQGSLSNGVLGQISRINRYGNTSACVNDPLVKKYCWCQLP